MKTRDRILLPFTYDVDQMVAECKALELNQFEYYNVIPLRSPAHLVDSSLPFPPPADDFADGTWTDWLDTPELLKSPYILSIVNGFKENIDVTLVRLLRLSAGAVVKEHTDPTLGLEIEKSVIRLTIPIIKHEKVDFYLNNRVVPMQPGECWYLRLTDPHKIENNSPIERINLTIDMRPNEWIKNIIAKSEVKVKEA